ncbi:uncharacterized protein DUF4145 [Rhodobacter sp. JA431]|uniref:DUF4145 domain-containing protein n=1 Tax=Rhodobacter sp. JA431 TaxID=570013 RepID=UPI000BDD098B|nr:DUF4145 domain-containing protein [Rhodobacter sp. JA431]SOC08380.1 uncharacterized protein DUF4145 [Rhodobacter sp. JA431]
MKYAPPSVHETAFNCPHCAVLAQQFWFEIKASTLKERRTPFVISDSNKDEFDYSFLNDHEQKEEMMAWVLDMIKGAPSFEKEKHDRYWLRSVNNVHISQCYNCEKLSIWVHERLIYPQHGEAPPPNPDLPEDILRDYNEASAILNLSPRGAAALIRLGIQKICKELGLPGKNINADIKSLVEKGLDTKIQRALDAVRVIGNNAVHPGEMDLRDDRATAESLFLLMNVIAEKMISEPKKIDEVYALLPAELVTEIDKRDRRGTEG